MFVYVFIVIVGISGLTAQDYSEDFKLSYSRDVSHLRVEYSTNTDGLVANSIIYTLWKDENVIHSSRINQKFGRNLQASRTDNGFLFAGSDSSLEFQVVEDSSSFTLISILRSSKIAERLDDCFKLKSQEISWYGGPEQKYQYWPVDRLSLNDYSYITKEEDYCAIAERYWLNSRGIFIYVEPEVPLFLNQIPMDSLCLTAEKKLPYYAHDNDSISFNYNIGIASDARQAHMMAIDRFLKKPKGYPDERMVKHPIWSTWARYYDQINDSVLLTYADEILKYKFSNSHFEIDDHWEICYGATEFDTVKFPNIRAVTDALKSKGFRVSLWVHPFINKGCEPYYTNALNNGYLVLDTNNNASTRWWRGDAAAIDFTKPEAAAWFTEKVRRLTETSGIDSFKFDAGESTYSPLDPVLNAAKNNHPLAITTDYIKTVSEFGPLIEVRSGFRNQEMSNFLRINDKDSDFTWNNGLPTLITTLLVLNMVGYPLVLPDMIGGNGYGNRPPNKELFIRWLQANVFMPSLQFSFVPWMFDEETINISLHYTDLHAQYADVIMERFELSKQNGDPVNPPIWWIAPDDRTAQYINDEFLLGENILVAPVVTEGSISRDIYLPRGVWVDQNGKSYNGPIWLINYPADLTVLPYFIKNESAVLKLSLSLLIITTAVIRLLKRKI